MSASIATVDKENVPANSKPVGRGTEVSGQLKPLVLLHGWGASPAVWQPLIEVLNTRCPELEIINLSWPGYGDEPALAEADNLNELAEVMLPKLPLDAHWLGWSLGGNLALWLAELVAQQSPSNKPSTEIQATQNHAAQSHTGQLIMLGSNASFAQREHWPEALSAEVLEQFRQGFDQAPEKTLKRFHGLQMQGESDLRGCKKAFTALVGKEMPADKATLAAGLKWLAELDLTKLDLTELNLTEQELSESAQSQLLRLHWLLGEHDPLVPVAVAEQLPGQVEVLSDCGHLPMLTQSEVLAEHLLRIIKAADDEQ